MAKKYKEATKKIVEAAKQFAEEKKREGWTKEDAAKSLAQFFEECKVAMNPSPAGDWLANAHLDKINNPQDQSIINTYEIGPPKASKKFTSQQLLDKGFLGLYMRKKVG